MKISIIIPTYNSEYYLPQALQSIKDQAYKNIEVLVADGGSKDNTLKIAQSFDFVRIVSMKDNGQTDGINKAYSFVTGDIVAWQNSDDVYDLNCFSQVVEAFANDKVDIVYGDYRLIDDKGHTIKTCRSHNWHAWKFKTGRFVPLQPTVFWNKRVSDSIFPLNEHLYYCMDVDLFAKAHNRGYQFLYLQKQLGSFRIHALGKTSQYKDILKVLKEHAKTLRANYNLNSIERIALFKNLARLFLIKLYLNIKNG